MTKEHGEMTKSVVIFESTAARWTKSSRYYYGYVSEEDLGDRCRMTFLIGNLRWFCKWLMMYGKEVEIESPPALKDTMEELIEELALHYSTAPVLK
jgi:predicted DNA-binding transcriptional regulator YafY